MQALHLVKIQLFKGKKQISWKVGFPFPKDFPTVFPT